MGLPWEPVEAEGALQATRKFSRAHNKASFFESLIVFFGYNLSPPPPPATRGVEVLQALVQKQYTGHSEGGAEPTKYKPKFGSHPAELRHCQEAEKRDSHTHRQLPCRIGVGSSTMGENETEVQGRCGGGARGAAAAAAGGDWCGNVWMRD